MSQNDKNMKLSKNKIDESKNCDEDFSIVDMLLIMIILYFFYDLILIEKVKDVKTNKIQINQEGSRNFLVKIIDNLQNLKVKLPKISLPFN